MLRLLHLSDIHFRTPYCTNPLQDRDGPIRDELIKDLESIVNSDDQKVSAILITGDIAFKADKEEYDFAAEWLDDLCKRLSCSPQNVYVVPGNHDVNRLTSKERIVSSLRQHILSKTSEAREKDFTDALLDETSGIQLIKPMEEYNQFAARYGCDISPKEPFWKAKLPIGPGVDLILNGLTSTFFSGESDAAGNLFLGNIQTNFRQEAGCVHLSMMHHPCDWFQNSDEVIDNLNNGAAIQLVGHKHKGRWDPGMSTVRIAADSIHPDRAEGGYEPGYNILDISFEKNDLGPANIKLSAKIRVLQNVPRVFRSKINSAGTEVFEYIIPVKQRETEPVSEKKELSQTLITAPNCSEKIVYSQNSRAKNRKIAFRFWNLRLSQRNYIIDDLNLLESKHYARPENERYRIAFENANSQGLINELLEKITAAENVND